MPTLIPSSGNPPTPSPPCPATSGSRDAAPTPPVEASTTPSGPELLLLLRLPLVVLVLVVLVLLPLPVLLVVLVLLVCVIVLFGCEGSRIGVACRAEMTWSRRSSAWRRWSNRCDSTIDCRVRIGVGNGKERATGATGGAVVDEGLHVQFRSQSNIKHARHTGTLV